MELKLGKLPAQSDRLSIRLADYMGDIPAPPPNFGHQALVPDWRMLANDIYGCCVFSGAGHEHELLSAEGGKPALFTDANVLAAYSAVTGFDPAIPGTDHGTVVIDALNYRRATGMTDSAGGIHKVEAFAKISPDPDAIAQAAWLFSAVGVGIQMPASAMRQFNKGLPWTLPPGYSPIQGGHYVPIIGRTDTFLVCVSWGRLQLISPDFMAKYCDEAYAIFCPEFFTNGKSPEGFDAPALQADMSKMTV